MSKHSLICHPDTPSFVEMQLSVEIARSDFNELVAVFAVSSESKAIVIPPPVRYASRHDGLWHTTCFEVFIQRNDDNGYFEFNFSPSTAWAGYEFEMYRTGGGAVGIDPPHFDVDILDHALILTVAADTGSLAGLEPEQFWQVALSAVIEEKDGTKSYWALRHPPGKPDFHHPDCFALTLPAPDAA